MQTLRGSYANGFAPRDGFPRYPQQWVGCVGAWCPSLGASGDVLRDWCGYQRHGTLTGMTLDSAWTQNAGTRSLAFVRASSQFVTMGSAWVVAAPLTLTGWFRSDDSVNSQEIVSIGNTGASGEAFRLNIVGGSMTVRAITSASGANRLSSSAKQWVANDWYFGAAVFANVSSRIAYVNGNPGTEDKNTATPSGLNATSIGRLEFGTPANYFSGMIDDVRIYNRALTTAEILAMWKAGRGAGYQLDRRYAVIEQAGGVASVVPWHLFTTSL